MTARGAISPRGLAGINTSAYSLVGSANQTRESYRDLLIFEERLKQNSERLASQRRKYEAFLLSLILSIAVLTYRVFLAPSPYTLIQFFTSGLLLIGIVTLILFFATGVYSEKIAYAYKFVPQANRALRYFNIYLNTKKPPRKWSYNPFKLFRATSTTNNSATAGSATSTPGLVRTLSNNSLRSTRSSPSPSSNTSPSSSSIRSRSPYNASSRSNAIPLAPLPPASNPRGELIFSSKVSQHYRDGYEKYRSDWEEKRRNKKAAGKQGDNASWFGSIFGSSSSRAGTPSSSQSDNEKSKSVGAKSEGAGISYAASPSDHSDSSSVEPSSARSRGRDARTRPLARSGSTSSISSSTFTSSPPVSRRSSPLRNAALASPSRATRLLTQQDELIKGGSLASNSVDAVITSAVSSNTSSRASTPELIRGDENYTSYYPHNRSSSSISTSTSAQSILINTGRTRREQTSSATSDSSIASVSFLSHIERRIVEDQEEEEEDEDDTLHSPPDMSPNSRIVNLPQGMINHQKAGSQGHDFKPNRHRASSFNEFLEELREEGMDT